MRKHFHLALFALLTSPASWAELVVDPSCEPADDIEAEVAKARLAAENPKDKVEELFADEPFDEQAVREAIIKASELCKKNKKAYEAYVRAHPGAK